MKNSFFLLIIASLIAAWVVPAVENARNMIPYILGLSIFLSFLSIRENIIDLIRGNKNTILTSFLLRFALLPLLFTLIYGQRMDEIAFMSVLLLIIAPTGLGAIPLAEKFKHNKECIASDVIVQNFAAVIMIPLLTSFYGTNAFDPSTIKAIFIRLIPMIFIPFAAAKLIHKFVAEEKITPFKKSISYLNSASIIAIVFFAANISFVTIKTTQISVVPALIAAILLSSFHFLLGFAIKKSLNKRIAMSVIFGYRNTSLTIWIAISFFNPATSLTAMFYIICQHCFNSILLFISNAKKVS